LYSQVYEATNESSSAKNDSVKSDRSTYQERFARELTKRDPTCRLCSVTLSLEGAHIVDASAKLTPSELKGLGIQSKYEIWNGILLCANHHHQYDYFHIGIDKDGFLWDKVNSQWIKDEAVNIYPTPELKNMRIYPDPILLQWKFDRFCLKRNDYISRLAYGFTSLFVTTPTKGSSKTNDGEEEPMNDAHEA
jgi:hypothetical protein